MNLRILKAEFEEAKAEAQSLITRLTSNGREPGPGETTAINEAMQRAQHLRARFDRAQSDQNLTAEIDRITTGGAATSMTAAPWRASAQRGHSLGAQFINSETFRWLKEHRHSLPSGAWSSPSSELMAATLTEDSASGGQLVLPEYQPGIVMSSTRPLVMSDLIAQGTTESNAVSYMRELTFTNASDTVAETGTKPESTLTFAAVSDPVRKIAHWIPVTEEMLADHPALSSYLDMRLRLGVQLTEDDQLLNGSVTPPDIVGFLARTGLATAVARGADTNADAILKQMAAIFNGTGLAATGIVLNPANWITIQLLKTAAGEYIAGNGPFSAPAQPTLWGLPVALTSAIAAGTALVGAFRTAAQIFRKGGLRVEASNSHASFFIENKVAIRAEERLALAVYRPNAFGTVTGLN